MVATFNISSFGRNCLIYESPDEVTLIRLIFVFVTIIIGTLTLFQTFKFYFKLYSNRNRNNSKSFPFLINFIFIIFILNVLIHNGHYADNIYRPSAYFEPKWLYVKYLISTMEITFFANFWISYLGIMGMKEIFSFEKNGLIVIHRSACFKMFGFIFGSLLTLGHYRTEPPSAYGPSVNFTIAGEGVVAIILLFGIFYCYKNSPKTETIYQILNQNDNDAESAEELLMDEIPVSQNVSARHRSPKRIE